MEALNPANAAFLADLVALLRKHNAKIWGCYCCGGVNVWTEDLSINLEMIRSRGNGTLEFHEMKED